MTTKATEIASYKSGTYKWSVFAVHDMKAMAFGDTGVVFGAATQATPVAKK